MAEPETKPAASYHLLFVVLAVLTLAAVGVSMTGMSGNTRLVVNLIIAGVQASVLSLFFMHLRKSDAITWLVAAAGLFWMFILFVLLLTDYLTRQYGAY
jgi:caa(3)-type oxidase subunit IV